MLKQVGTNNDDPYWAMDVIPTPTCTRVVVDEESVDDSISTVKTAASQQKKVL